MPHLIEMLSMEREVNRALEDDAVNPKDPKPVNTIDDILIVPKGADREAFARQAQDMIDEDA